MYDYQRPSALSHAVSTLWALFTRSRVSTIYLHNLHKSLSFAKCLVFFVFCLDFDVKINWQCAIFLSLPGFARLITYKYTFCLTLCWYLDSIVLLVTHIKYIQLKIVKSQSEDLYLRFPQITPFQPQQFRC